MSAPPNQSTKKPQKKKTGFKAVLKGLARDFWKDGPPPASWVAFKAHFKALTAPKSPKKKPVPNAARVKKPVLQGGWKATRPQILEELWGKGHHLPGGDALVAAMITPLGLNSEMNVLDLSAGMGASQRYLNTTYKTYVTGMEQDAELVERGREILAELELISKLPLTAFTPSAYVADKHYHCVLGQNLFSTIIAKKEFFTEIVKSLHTREKPRGQVAFLDYALDDAAKDAPYVKAWLKANPKGRPISIAEMTKVMKQAGLDLRVTEDLTQRYRQYILLGLADFATFLSSHEPEPETKNLVLQEIQRWGLCVGAIKQGLKYYRYYAILS